MPESQHVEWKQTWRDEFLKWICGFANAEGGVLEIGRADDGTPVGVADAKTLLEELPNKIRDVLGIIADVHLIQEAGRDLIRIRVEPYPSPISYKGQYHYRSGSTKQELKGPALEQFLLKKRGLHWDGVPEPGFALADCQAAALEDLVQRGQSAGRIDAGVTTADRQVLLGNLNLAEGAYLKRAAALLFAKDPERFALGASIKLGFFINDADLRYQDEVRGPLIQQVDRAMELLTTKYLKAYISYRGIQRIERFVVPREALREALLNAVIHKDYSTGIPIQIRVYDNQVRIWNDGRLPDGWTADTLLGAHASKPYNPLIAAAFFRAGMIESWGRGIQKITSACATAGCPKPTFVVDQGGLMLTFPEPAWLKEVAPEASGITQPGLGDGLGEKLGESRAAILAAMRANPTVSTPMLAEQLGLSTTAIDKHLKALRESGLIRRVGPAKGGHWEVLS
jgi:ATP-dependent DNA helicase RecG